ncbi:MAG TPA: polysaccharide deacetylase family protein [Acidimicrobiales bacterium]|nr:polysaccharide deacetylase family protein [Acidimicrobiales bacterium]
MDNELYSYQPITERTPLSFPDGKKLAFYVGLNVEHFYVDKPFMRPSVPDPMSHGQRDYGTRVGIWRLMDLFDELGVRASAITNSDVCSRYPQIVKAGVERDWAWIAHGQTNSIMQSGMGVEEEEKFLWDMFDAFDDSLPARPKGWLGPGLSETFETPRILAEYGLTYLLDWCCDDQPFPLEVPGMISVPYGLEINDIGMWMATTLTGADYETMVLDQFEVLMEDAQKTGMVMALPIHTFVVGQPHLFKHFAAVMRKICAESDVWVTTSDEIAEHYLSSMATS